MKINVIVLFLSVVGYSCANPHKRIVGGEPVTNGAYPYQASLQRFGSGGFAHSCGVVIINSEWVLTAAHCTVGSTTGDFRILAGVDVITDNNGQLVTVRGIHEHPDFVNDPSMGYPNDISLLQISPLTLNAAVGVIPLASGITNFVGSTCTMTGWGVTESGWESERLREASDIVLSGMDCDAIWLNQAIDDEYHVCVGLGDRGPCQGDDGGPLVCSENNFVLAGLASWGHVSCADYPFVYTRVSTYRAWVCSVSGVC
ncbi:unnamed protein product [Owenia fusiformis]|uniref:Uncharacterized protein n=1 Tax=Owenia fusiformis TaxID=6347 RepID=A0A8J1U0R3_OWEFU|nr:unnamed protein product [Owenia fusiformis]